MDIYNYRLLSSQGNQVMVEVLCYFVNIELHGLMHARVRSKLIISEHKEVTEVSRCYRT